MNAHQLGVAIVGCGTIGRIHAAAAAECDLEVVALVDEVEPAAMALANSIEASGRRRPAVYRTIDDALFDPAVGLVAVATPSGQHVKQGLTVLAAGRHLILEKPLDVDLTRAAEIQTAAASAARSGVVASVISQHRFDEASQIVAQAIANQRFGRLTSAIASLSWWRSQGYYDSGDWRGTWALDGGGALMNQGVHTVDLLLWFLGRPVHISAHTGLLAHQRIDVEDTAVATMTFEFGALAVLHATTAAYPALTARIQVMGSAGSAVIDGDELTYYHAARPGDDVGPLGLGGGGNQAAEVLGRAEAPHDIVVTDPTADHAGHARQYADVLRAIRNGGQPGVTVADAVVALATVRSVYLSATLGAPVLFDDVLAGRYNDVTVRTSKQ
ncbi:Gfo/Idh/MocA family oxidoreductase [Streptomyces sp. NPDC046900]|uniref:Gfo/Idh/MocA family protein n=1 Tax=Streptomyces sp. NPDC046900 TaxID=3155473 RepID=UPI0033F378F0